MAGMLPSELRKLMSEGHMGPKIKLDSDPPPKVKAFIDKVIIEYPLEDLAIPLSEFHWEYNKGNFYHWRPLVLHFKTYFKTYLSSRKDLLLEDTLEYDTPFPKRSILQILRVMHIILENCPNKSSFDGLEYFKLLLASTDPEVLIATLETLAALVKINPLNLLRARGKLVGCGSSINNCLLSLAQGWGTKKDGLSLYSSAMIYNEESKDDEGQPSDHIQTAQNHVAFSLSLERTWENLQSMDVIHTVNLDMPKVDDLLLMKIIVKQCNIRPERRFSLLTRIRYTNAFCSSTRCEEYSRIFLLAFIVLVQASDSRKELVSFFADNEPEYTDELIRLVKSEETIPVTIRTLAMHALGSKVAAYTSSDERAQILSGSRISFADGDHMVFLNVLKKEILSLNNFSDPSSIAFVEAILQFYLLYVISTSITESVIIQESGMLPAFLSLLGNSVASHMHLVCLAVKTLQKLMDYSNSDVTLFNNLGGVDLLTNRLQIEVSWMINSSNANLNVDSQNRLIRVMLKALGSALANSTRPPGGHDDSLLETLSMIFKNVNKFGGDVYSAAVTVMSGMIHKDRTCYSSLDESSLPNSFLESVIAGVLPSSKALTCVPNGIAAISVDPKGLEAINKTSALGFLVDVLTDKKYVIPVNAGIVPFANAVMELLRLVSLRDTVMDMIIKIVKGKTGKVNKGNARERDTEDKENVGPWLVGSTDSGSEGICDEQFIQLCIFHVMVLVHRTTENAETCRLFVEKEGIEALLKLVVRPSITQSSKGMSIALHSAIIFERFTQHHSAALARAFCSTLKEYLKSTLNVLSGSFVQNLKAYPHSGVFSSLFLFEFLLFLASSEDIRWVTALLQEFGNDSKDVLESIGNTHRELLWQIALLEDSKSENEDDNRSSGSADGSFLSQSNTSKSEEQRLYSLRQFLNQLLKRQMSGWSFESQFFDLITLYRDLTDTSGPPQHLGGRSHQSLPLRTSKGASCDGAREADKQRSYYAPCCDIMKSVSFHITWLFQELGKAMLVPFRRRNDMVTVTPASKSVACTFATIAFDHMNFEGHVNPSGSVASWSPKCRYLGKVVDFIDEILLEEPDTCNPVLLNYIYDSGVIHSVLTTFGATSKLLFTVNRTSASPMETDEGAPKPYSKGTVWSSIDGSLASYGKLMDHLVTSSFILSPFTKQFLTQTLVIGGNAFPCDAEVFVKVLQSSILKAVLPVWKHPQFADSSDDFIASVILIICHVCSGVEVRSASNTYARSVARVMNLGYRQPIAEEALRQVESNNVQFATEWLCPLPEEVPEDETMQLLPVDDLLSTCKDLLEMKDSLALPVRGLLSVICSQDDGRYRSNVISFVQAQLNAAKNNTLSSLFHVLPLMLHEDKDTLEVASKCGLVKVAANLLYDWNARSPEDGTGLVPKWVTAAFLAVDQLAQVDQKLNADTSESLKKDEAGKQNSEISSKHIDVDEQKRLVEISCGFLGKLLPAETNHAILQLCSTLTRTYSVALSFLDAGGLPLLLSLRTSSLFVGTDNVAETIIRRTLRQTSTDGQVNLGRITKFPTANTKNAKAQRKPPERFTTVLELLLKSVITFVPSSEEKSATRESSSVLDIDIVVNSSKGKGKAIAMGSDRNEESGQESSASLAKVVSILKLLKEILRSYSPSFYVLLQNDAGQSGIFQHLFKFLPHLRSSKDEKKDENWRHELADRASQLLVFSCVHSIEARTRIFKKINKAFIDFVENCRGNRRPGSDIQAFVNLLGHVLAAQSPNDASISKESLDTFKDLGLVKSITQTLEMLDLDHPDSQIIVTGLLKVLDLVTEELVLTQPSDQGQHGETENTGDISRSTETVSLLNASSAPAGDMPGNEGDEDEDRDDDGQNDLKEDEVHHLPHHDTDQVDEDDDGGVLFRLSEEINGINMLDHRFNNDPLHLMPVEVFGSNRQGQTDNAREGHLEQLDSFFQSLRNGPHRQPQYHDMQFGSRSSGSIPTVDEPQGVNDAKAPFGQPQYVDTQFDQNDGVLRDVEAVPVSQESSGSGATSRARVKGVFNLVETNKWATYNISITAIFPSEQQEKVLDILPSGLVKEGHSWVEWFACQHNPTLVESSRRGEGVGSSMDRAVIITVCRSGSKPVETDGTSLVDKEDLKAIIGLLRVDQQESRMELQKLLLNLCAYDETRSSVVDILMNLLMLEMRKPDNNSTTSDYRLYECQHDVTYARPQSCDGKVGQDYAGVSIASNSFVCMLRVPPLISRRVLETLTYLASRNTFVAKLLLQFRLPPLDSQSQGQSRGKAIMDIQDGETEEQQEDIPAITMLLSLLRHPLYLKSIAHLEQLLKLLDVIINSAEIKQPLTEHGASVSGAANPDADSHTILLNLPRTELRRLGRLLAHESLSDNAYALVVEVLKKLVTIAPHHCYVFIRELYYNTPPLIVSAMDELKRFNASEKALITASDGTVILRVIHAMSSLVASLDRGKDQTLAEDDLKDTLSTVSDINSDLELLWTELRTCISKIENYSGTSLDVSDSSMISLRPSGAMSLLPAGTHNIISYIESFFVMCKVLHPQSSLKPPVKADEIVKFSNKHRKLLNAFIRQNPGLLEKSFSVMLKFPRFIDFDIKRSHFSIKVKPQDYHHRSPLPISVRRSHILEDSYNQLRMRSTQDLKGRLTVDFQGEEGIDVGGLTREWYQVLSRNIVDNRALLFTTFDGATFQPNPKSVQQPEHLLYFKFVGRVVGKALSDGQLFDVHFTRPFYKHILGAKVTYHDFEAIDPDVFKNMQWVLKHDIRNIPELTFSIDADEQKKMCEKSEVTDYELTDGGRNMRVTEENKHRYVDLYAKHRLTTAIRPQIDAFLEGFYELIPRDLICIFNVSELELLISGLPNIDLDDMKANTEYTEYSAGSPVIQWFWEVAQGFSEEDKARLLQFVTGTSKVPLDGFSALQGSSGAQKFQIHKAYGGLDLLPTAHTCFNQLDLPEYPSKEHLEEKLLLAIHEANEGFGFG